MQSILTFLLTLLGLILAFSIPAMWFAWTPNMFVLIIAAGVIAALLYMLLYPASDMAKPTHH